MCAVESRSNPQVATFGVGFPGREAVFAVGGENELAAGLSHAGIDSASSFIARAQDTGGLGATVSQSSNASFFRVAQGISGARLAHGLYVARITPSTCRSG